MALTKVGSGGIENVTNAANATFLTIDASEQITVASEGGAVTTSLQQGLAKHWINMFGDDASVRDSLNMSSTTDNATGKKTVNVTNAFSNANFATTTSTGETTSNAGNRASSSSPVDSDTYLFAASSSNSGGFTDNDFMTASSFGDLA